MKRNLLFALSIVLGAGLACSPRFTSKVSEPGDEPGSSPKLGAIIRQATISYEAGVDFYVKEEFDSATVYLERAVWLLSQDVGWSPYDETLSERRHLLYKCRYFLERIPSVAVEQPSGIRIEDIVPTKRPLPSVELVRNSRVDKWIRYYTGDGRESLTRWVRRSGKYREGMLRILKEEGIPLELINLALIESGFYPQAYSRARAVGMWQFIESTGKIYGLRIDWWVDERRDPAASTRAAARHLRDLYESLDSWPLALAAYNWGQRRVESAMRRHHTDDYWELRINSETSNYVPKFMAACIIMDDPQEYGFSFDFDRPLRYEEIDVEPKTHLGAVAKSCEVDTSAILDLNPHLVRGCAPEGKSYYPVRIPEGKLEMCRAELVNLSREERIAKTFLSPTVKHKVTRGETLSGIASRYGVRVADITSANGIRNRDRIRIGQVLTIPGGEFRGPEERPGIHVVKRHETLTSIAGRYGVKVRDLERWNSLSSPHLIYPGQRLALSPGVAAGGGPTLVHSVTYGETLSGIADKYEVSLQEILDANKLSRQDVIRPEQKIRIPGAHVGSEERRVLVHKVKSGDTVSEIAAKYDVSSRAVLDANGLTQGCRIYPGQELLVPVAAGKATCGRLVLHEVKKGESIYSIAKKYSASCDDVLRLNGLGTDAIIYPGQKIAVAEAETEAPRATIHTVARGETLSEIAELYGVTTKEVLRTNGLGSGDKIYPGQEIIIPAR